MKRNLSTQYYKGIPLRLINRQNYRSRNAKRFIINETNQNIWIPSIYLDKTGTIKNDVDLDWIFKTRYVQNKLKLAGIKSDTITQFFCYKVSRMI